MVAMKASASGFFPSTYRAGKAILCVQINVALRHVAARHDPNAEQHNFS